jgi:3-hydroxymyristoyl/3-hydroxydecanoyl-(acyl carrier protein) dehydratase
MGSERIVLEGKDLEGALAHRGRNLIIDRAECFSEDGEPFGESAITLSPGDATGRDVFLRDTADGGKAIIEYAFAEHLALNAICVLSSVGGGLEEGDISYFASISGFTVERAVPAGVIARGHVARKSDKGQFRRFGGTMTLDGGEPVAKANITSYHLHVSEEPPREIRKLGEVVPSDFSRPVDRSAFGWKRPEMVFVDEMVTMDAAGRTAGFAYTYPADHPFAAGHFPGNPIMMGITQWMSISDAASWLLRELVLAGGAAPGKYEMRCSGELLRDDGTIVAGVKGLRSSAAFGPAGEIGPRALLETKRVVFREMVRPEEPLRVRVRIDALENV